MIITITPTLKFQVSVLTKWAFINLAERINWYFGKLLRLGDNDLKEYEGFDYIEVQFICEQLCYELDTETEYVERLKKLLPVIKD